MTIMGITLSAAVIWLIAAAILAIVEACTVGLITIWFAGGAVAAAIVAMLGGSFAVQFIVFLVISVVLIYFTRPLVKKKLKVGTTKTNTDALIGKNAIVTKTITELEAGQVKINGMEWTAVAGDRSAVIDTGATVTIIGIEGVKLIVSN